MTDTPEQKKPQGRRRSWARRLAMWCGALVVGIGFGIGAGILWLTDRPVEAPNWVRTRVAQQIAANTDAVRISFGGMVLTVQSGWRPQVRILDLEYGDETGRTLFALSELDASLAMRPLLRGNVQPKRVALTGIFATLRRDSDGRLALITAQDGGAPAREAATMAELVEQLDDLFLRPEMAAMTELSVDNVTLRLEDARAARAWTIDGARLRVNRQARNLTMSADLALLSGGTDVATVEANYTSQLGDPVAQFGVTVADMSASDLAAFTPAFAWLGALRAPISGSLRSGIEADGGLAPVNATLQIGEGVLQPTEKTRPIPFTSAQTYFTFDPDQRELVFDQLAIESAWVSGQLEGRARLSGLEQGALDEMVGQFSLSNLTLDPPGLYRAPLALSGAEVDFRLRPNPFQVDLGHMRIVDGDSSILLDGALLAQTDGWKLNLNGAMPQITPARLLELWPPDAAAQTRNWVDTNLESGLLNDLEFALRAAPDTQPDVYFSFAFEDATVRYLRSMSPVHSAKGVASMLRNRFVVAVEQGLVTPDSGGDIDVAGSSFIIPDVTVKDGAPAVARLRTDSDLEATLSLLDQAPLNIMTKAGLPVDLGTGRATTRATLSLPLAKDVPGEEIRYSVEAKVADLATSRLVANRRIESPSLEVRVDNSQITIAGPGTFDGIALDATWSQALGAAADGTSRVVADVELSPAGVDALNLGLPPGTVSGRGTGQLQIDLAQGSAPQFRLTSALAGVGLSVPALDWSKPRTATGDLTVAGRLGQLPTIDLLQLSAPGLSATGNVRLRDGGGLDVASFDAVRIGNWLNAPVRVIGRGVGVAPAVEVRGGALDLRQAQLGGAAGRAGGGGGQSGPISLSLNSLQITDKIALTNFQGRFDVSGGLQGDFSGNVNGAAAVTGQVAPQRGRSAVRLQSGDAGSVFKAAGLLKQARGGDMNLVLQPVGTAGAFNGSLTIKDTRVRDAPAIAALFNALSVVGLLEQMNGQGLHFAEVEAAFRLTPDRVTLTEASAVGPSIGLSMDGTYDVNSAEMDMRGVFSPIYLINGVGSILTRKGEGLIGFNFRLRGPAASPKVQVNPLSALTPGIFREIFRRAPPDVALEPGEGANSAPEVPQTQRRTRTRIELGD